MINDNNPNIYVIGEFSDIFNDSNSQTSPLYNTFLSSFFILDRILAGKDTIFLLKDKVKNTLTQNISLSHCISYYFSLLLPLKTYTMRGIHFYKYQSTGNDFILIDNRLNTFPKEDTKLVAQLCERRFGVGELTIVDGDVVDTTNKNRQLIALDSTMGKSKAQLMGERLKDINKDLKLTIINEFLTPEMAYQLVSEQTFSYVADCIDSITPKLNLLRACHDNRMRVISSMGAGGILDPTKVKVADISKTRDCPLARHIRKRLKKEKINPKFKAVFSLELPAKDMMELTDGANFKRSYYGTMSYMPALFGIHMAGAIIQKLLEN